MVVVETAARYQFTLIPTAATVGVPVANSQIQVNATNTKIRATGVVGNEVCETYLFPVSQFRWTLISNTSTRSPRSSIRSVLIVIRSHAA